LRSLPRSRRFAGASTRQNRTKETHEGHGSTYRHGVAHCVASSPKLIESNRRAPEACSYRMRLMVGPLGAYAASWPREFEDFPPARFGCQRPRATYRDVRFGSLADIGQPIRDVCFTLESRHVERRNQCPLSANSRHSVRLLRPHRKTRFNSVVLANPLGNSPRV
jgi:hypothetical protein